MRYASGTATAKASTTEGRMQHCLIEVCEETGEPLFRAGDYAAPGEYIEVETRRHVTLLSPDFLPACMEGQTACYRLLRRNWRETGAQALAEKQTRFHALVAHSHKRIYHFVQRHLGNAQDAEDLMQEALTRAWTHFESFNPQRSFEAWVYRIASNLVIDQVRRRRRRQEFSLDAPATDLEGNEHECRSELADSTGDPENCLMANEISESLQFALRSLPPIHRKTLLLVAQQHSYEQIAGVLDCSIGTVRSRVYRARVMVQRNLKESTPHE